MATLADRHRVKRYLKIRASSVRDDALIDELLASAEAMIDTFLAALSRERATASTESTSWTKVQSYRRGVVVSGDSSTTVTGSVTIISIASLASETDYDTRIKPQLIQDEVDTVAHLFRQRNPTALSETEGGGISEGWDDVGSSGLPKRVERRLRNLISTIEA